ncbi:tetratricopeptide repeat protein [Streptomyces sp. NPDC050535]|uniref:tetratricopeptide repeat protein n=1 Tax=Streptomyces sp. NPDC050535 TaxID=3365626 RepID=UPI0037A60891
MEQAQETVRGLRSGNSGAVQRIRELFPDVRQVADSGDSEFQELVGGVALEYMKNYEAAYWYLGQAAKAGNPAAQRGLGFLFFQGLGIAKDVEKALDLFRMAAAGGDAAAKLNLAEMHLRGDLVSKSEKKALRYFEEASSAGMEAASRRLGELKLADGDFSAARRYLEVAVDQGSYRALKDLASMCRDGVGGEVDRVRAVGCYLKLLDVGDGDGMHEAHQLADLMTDAEIREAASWANHVAEGESLIRRARR